MVTGLEVMATISAAIELYREVRETINDFRHAPKRVEALRTKLPLYEYTIKALETYVHEHSSELASDPARQEIIMKAIKEFDSIMGKCKRRIESLLLVSRSSHGLTNTARREPSGKATMGSNKAVDERRRDIETASGLSLPTRAMYAFWYKRKLSELITRLDHWGKLTGGVISADSRNQLLGNIRVLTAGQQRADTKQDVVIASQHQTDTIITEIATKIDDLVLGNRVIRHHTLEGTLEQSDPLKSFHVPNRYLLFSGREEMLATLHSYLSPGQDNTGHRPVSISGLGGLGGVGKTELAIEYAHRYWAADHRVFWIRGDTKDNVVSDYLLLAKHLGLECDETKADETVESVKLWLTHNSDWLMVLDNVEDPYDIVTSLLPPNHQGRALLTTRSSDSSVVRLIPVSVMETNEGITLLLKRANLDRDSQSAEALQAVSELVEQLGCLPLALDQAGAYIGETECGIEAYFTMYRQCAAQLLAERRPNQRQDKRYPASVLATWTISIDKIRNENPVAMDILHTCAFLHPDAIPRTLLEHFLPSYSSLGAGSVPVLELNKAMATILQYSLLSHRQSGFEGGKLVHTLSIHRLVQMVIQSLLDKPTLHKWVGDVVNGVGGYLKGLGERSWKEAPQLVSHVQVCADRVLEHHVSTHQALYVVREHWSYLVTMGSAQEASKYAEYAIDTALEVYGSDHIEHGQALLLQSVVERHNDRPAESEQTYRQIVSIFAKQSDDRVRVTACSLGAKFYHHFHIFDWAAALHRHALSTLEKWLGPEHPDVATTLDDLALLYRDQGKYEEALPLFQRALATREKALEPEHPDVATTLNGLAVLYRTQGKYEDAGSLFRRALSIREKAFGPEHLEVATTLNDLAALYNDQGGYGDAEPLYQRALSIREKALGPNHPSVATTLNELSRLYRNQGKYEDALTLLQRALAIREKSLGPEHPDVATALNNLAILYYDQGKYEAAEPFYRRALSGYEKALGPAHFHVASTLNNLALIYREQGKYEDALPLFQRALSIQEKSFGPEHPRVATFLDNLAILYTNQGKYEEALPLFQRALVIREKLLGSEHPNVAITLNGLAALYTNQGKYEDALPLFQRALSIQEKSLEPEHSDTATGLDGLAALYRNQGKYEEALPLLQRALSIREKLLGPEHPKVATTLNELAALYRDQDRYGEAEPLFQRVLAIQEKSLGPEHPDVVATLNNLASLQQSKAGCADGG